MSPSSLFAFRRSAQPSHAALPPAKSLFCDWTGDRATTVQRVELRCVFIPLSVLAACLFSEVPFCHCVKLLLGAFFICVTTDPSVAVREN